MRVFSFGHIVRIFVCLFMLFLPFRLSSPGERGPTAIGLRPWIGRATHPGLNENGYSISLNTPLHTQENEHHKDKLDVEYAKLLEYMKQNRFGVVVTRCKELIQRDKRFTKSFKLLVMASHENDLSSHIVHALDETIHFFNGQLEHDPYDPYWHYGLGLCYRIQGHYQKAIESFEKSIDSGARFYEVFDELVFYYKHKEHLKGAKALFGERIKLNPSNPFLYQGMGLVSFRLSEFREALSSWKKALELQRMCGARRQEALCLRYMGFMSTFVNDYKTAMGYLNESMMISEEIGDKVNEAFCLPLVSFVHYCLGNISKAIDLGERGITMAREMAERRAEYECCKTLGFIYVEKGELPRAQRYLEQSTGFYEETEDLRNLEVCQYWLAVVHHEKGNYTKALRYAKNALRISQQIGYKTGDAFNLTAIGDIYFSLGNYAKALECHQKALRISERKIAKWSEETSLNTIGHIYLKNKEYQKALEYFQRALDLIYRSGHEREEAHCLYNLGYANLKTGDLDAARKFVLKSLKQAREHGHKIVLAFDLNCLGEIFFELGDLPKAEKCYLEALVHGREMGHPNIIWEAYSGLGSVSVKTGEHNQAIDYFMKAIDAIEDLRSQIRFREFSAGFFKSKISVYEDIMNLLYDLHTANPMKGYDKECFYFAEKAKARAFLDDLREAEIDYRKLMLSDKKQTEIDTLSGKISKIITSLYSYDLDEKSREELLYELQQAENDFESINEDIRSKHMQKARILSQEPARLEEIQNKLLDDKSALVEYFIGESNLFAFFIAHDDIKIHRFSTEETRTVFKLANNYIKLLSTKGFPEFEGEIAAGKLYERLISPLNESLTSQVDKMIIVPDGDFYYLPFETLIRGVDREEKENRRHHFLVEDFEISYGPSASILVLISDRSVNQDLERDLLAIGDPLYEVGMRKISEPINTDDIIREYYLTERFDLSPLRFASKEIRSITKLVKKGKRQTLLRKEAREENVKELPLSEYKVIHFATHSFLDEKIASRSSLVLTLDNDPVEDGFFRAREIYDTRLNADLIVLSACQTAKGKKEKGEGIQGLSRAFICAGADSVLASLWNINDRSTAEFMKNFYSLLVQGKSKREALRLAKLQMINSQYGNPYFWAAFVLIGEAESQVELSKASLWDRFLSLF